VVIIGTGYLSDSRVFINGKKLSAHLETAAGTTVLVARLKKAMLAAPGPLVIEFENPDGAHSNQFTLQVVPD
jgi:hypothetical protein